MTRPTGGLAVMQQRRTVAPDALDYFPTPPWATRALCEFLQQVHPGDLRDCSVWEPACGELHMARALGEYFGTVRASDVHPYGDHEVADFTLAPAIADEIACTDFVITNPPFRLALDFIRGATAASRLGFAMLVRTSFLEGGDRHSQLWSVFPPTYVLQFAERVVMLEGRLVQAGAVDPCAEKPGTKASTATSYVWLVWLAAQFDTRLRWIGPCRDRLERPGDYPDYSVTLPPPPDGLFGGQP